MWVEPSGIGGMQLAVVCCGGETFCVEFEIIFCSRERAYVLRASQAWTGRVYFILGWTRQPPLTTRQVQLSARRGHRLVLLALATTDAHLTSPTGTVHNLKLSEGHVSSCGMSMLRLGDRRLALDRNAPMCTATAIITPFGIYTGRFSRAIVRHLSNE